MHFREYGDVGPLALLLHGCPLPSDTLVALAERLADRWHVVLPDLPAYGSSKPLRSPYSLRRMDRAIGRLIGDRDGDGLVIIGAGFGFHRGLRIALSRNRVVNALVGLGPIVGIHDDVCNDTRNFASAMRYRVNVAEILAERYFSRGYADRTPTLLDEMRRWLSRIPADHLANELEAFANGKEMRSRLRYVRSNVLMVSGSEDVVYPPWLVRDTAGSLERCDVEQIDGSGNVVALENSDDTLRIVDDWLAENGNGD